MSHEESPAAALQQPRSLGNVQLTPAEVVEVGALVRKLGAHSPVRGAAETVMGGFELRPFQVEALFSALSQTSSLSWKERVVSAWCLGRAQLADVEREAAAGTLLRILDPSASKQTRLSWRKAWLRYAIAFPFLLGTDISAFPGPVLTGMFLPAILVASLFYDRRAGSFLRSAVIASLGHLKAPETIGVLAAAAYDRDSRVRDIAGAALHEALPAVTQEHFGLLDQQSIRSLAGLLKHADNLLVFKALDALEKVGTGSVIPDVESLRGKAKIARMQQRANAVLAILRERQKQEDQGKTLLRATTSPDAPCETLVRPAPSIEADQSLLLRAAADSTSE